MTVSLVVRWRPALVLLLLAAACETPAASSTPQPATLTPPPATTTGAPATASPSAGTSPALGMWCVNHDVPFAVSYPPDWFVHAPDATKDIVECEHFGPAPFGLAATLTIAYRTPPEGTLISMRVMDGCFGFVEPPLSQTSVVAGGRDGLRIETRDISDPEDRSLLWYVVPLTNGPCQGNDYEFLGATTLESAGGDYEQNKAILDAMMLGLEFTATPR